MALVTDTVASPALPLLFPLSSPPPLLPLQPPTHHYTSLFTISLNSSLTLSRTYSPTNRSRRSW
jgi:hypothetical protein